MTTLVFQNMEAYEKWTDQFENTYDYQEIPTAIDDGWTVAVDMFTKCRGWKTALRRFRKAFKDVNPEINAWVDGMEESCASGCFQDTTGWKPAWTTDPEEVKVHAKGGKYSWGVEQHDDFWYMFLNISGVYAGRDKRKEA